MLNRIFIITQNSFRELYRDRFFLILILAVIVFFVLSLLLGELSFEEHKKILFDLGISAIHWLNIGVCLFLGGISLRKELEKQTYMTLLSTPLSRMELILGKFGGIYLATTISTVLLGSGLLFMLNSLGLVRNFSAILVGIIAEAAILLSLSILLNLLFSPFVALFSGFGVFLVGNWLESLKSFADQSKIETYIKFADIMSWIFPNLYRLNWRSVYILDEGVSVNVGSASLIHAVAWLGLNLFLAQLVFKNKNLI